MKKLCLCLAIACGSSASAGEWETHLQKIIRDVKSWKSQANWVERKGFVTKRYLESGAGSRELLVLMGGGSEEYVLRQRRGLPLPNSGLERFVGKVVSCQGRILEQDSYPPVLEVSHCRGYSGKWLGSDGKTLVIEEGDLRGFQR